MNALEAASLVMIPSGYEDGTLGSLKPTDGTGDFTFSRGSNISATRVNADGYIEKGYENLLLQSNSFTTTWANINSTETSGQQGYDGSNDAWLLEKSAANGFIYQSISTSGVQTLSIYAKQGSANSIRLLVLASGGSGEADYNLSTGVIDSTSPSVIGSANIQDVGNGWYRCSFSVNFSPTTQLRIYPAENGSTSSTSGSVYIQDAMLNQGLVAYPYVETTTAPVAGGILEDMPRLDYTDSSCPSLLLEPSRTNLMYQSELSSILNSSPNLTKVDNAALSPEGVQNAMEFVPTTAFTNAHYCVTSGVGSLIAGTKYTFSSYIKPNGFNYVQVGGFYGDEWAFFNLSTGTLISLGSSASSGNISSVGNGWYRCDVTYTFQNAIGNFVSYVGFRIYDDEAKSYYSGDGVKSIYAYGLQLEQDATYPTSYIPTYGVSQTRLRDTTANLSSPAIAGATEFTWFFDNTDSVIEPAALPIFFLQSELNENLIYWATQGGRFYSGSYFGFPYAVGKVCVKYDGTTFTMFLNGVKSTDTLTKSFAATRELRALNSTNEGISGPLHQMLFFKTALSDEACIELTTI